MPETDLELLVRAAREAGGIARPHWRSDPRTWDKGDGAGPVTEADLAVNAHLHALLGAARPGYGWLSEESEDDPARLSAERVFIVDPIDGTRAFIAGETAWSHSLAVAENGRITTAAVYLPVADKLYAAAAGQGATLNGAPIRTSAATDPETATLLASRPVVHPDRWRAPMPTFARHFRPSLAYRLCLVAEGRFDAMLALRPTWEWDVAAGTLIVTEAGGTATSRTGAPLTFNARHPQIDGTLAAAPALHAPLLSRLA
ncbi:3'(2'),5'-bisphosphate nucleotidase CysQ [Oceaniglobus roseus]|uniref:3'(2'),5'-bisphosphate nucleotidase CysQ n=1 Tax=Oceaniglobus roseus TaxID=1737570 RepID=UPI000C7ED393|nr:3'(2'),5'-bisphosphate nucleotidase CysQ [Kandeliimicrobium roseum]